MLKLTALIGFARQNIWRIVVSVQHKVNDTIVMATLLRSSDTYRELAWINALQYYAPVYWYILPSVYTMYTKWKHCLHLEVACVWQHFLLAYITFSVEDIITISLWIKAHLTVIYWLLYCESNIWTLNKIYDILKITVKYQQQHFPRICHFSIYNYICNCGKMYMLIVMALVVSKILIRIESKSQWYISSK